MRAALASEGINPASIHLETLEFEMPEDDGIEEQAQPVTPTGLVLSDSFWESMDTLSYIRRVAHTRGVSADGLLYTVLAWVSAISPYECRLDTGMVSHKGASLNLFVARVGDSGGGKTASADVLARELVRPDIYLIDIGEEEALPLGTGEGLVEHYMDKVDIGQKYSNGNRYTSTRKSGITASSWQMKGKRSTSSKSVVDRPSERPYGVPGMAQQSALRTLTLTSAASFHREAMR
jgi:hypothetical protein